MMKTVLLVIAFWIFGWWVVSIAHAQDDAKGYVVASAEALGVPTDLALRVSRVETKTSCHVVGSHGERGPLQILPRTAASIGYGGIKSASCATQTRAGMKYLYLCFKGAHGNKYRAAACHNAGLGSLKWRRLPFSAKRYANSVMN